MKFLINKIKSLPREFWIKNSFLVPILSVVGISIAHVISWYDLGNPIAWAIYLSIAIEIFALASVSAASIKINKSSIWFLFAIVTLIQIIGNVFFIYQFIDVTNETFLLWVELIEPWFIDWELVDHKRLLALIQGGTLPFMSLIALHFYIKFNEQDKNNSSEESVKIEDTEHETDEIKNDIGREDIKEVKESESEQKKYGFDTQEEINKKIKEYSEPMFSDKELKENLKQQQKEEEEKSNKEKIVKEVKKRKNKSSYFTGRTKKDSDGNNIHPKTTPGI